MELVKRFTKHDERGSLGVLLPLGSLDVIQLHSYETANLAAGILGMPGWPSLPSW
jgi:hypothetical protein